MVITAIVCCHGNSLQYTPIDENGIPGVCVANLHCECQELKPKVETNTSFLVLHPSSGVDTLKTVGSHLSSVGDTLRVVYSGRLSWTYYRTFQGLM